MRKPIRTVGLGTDRHRRYQNSKLSLSLSCSSELFSLTNTKLIILSHQTLTLVTATINVSLRQSSNTTTPLIIPPQALIFNATALIIFDLRPTFFLCFDMFFIMGFDLCDLLDFDLWVSIQVVSICGYECQFMAQWLWVSTYQMHHSESTVGKLHHWRPENRPPPMMSEAGVVVTDPYGGVTNFPNNHTYCTDNTPRCPPFSGKL